MTTTETPILDISPKAIAAIIQCQRALAKYIIPDSEISDKEIISELLGILDDKELVEGIKAIDLK